MEVLVSSQGAAFMTNVILQNIVDLPYSLTARGLMDAVPGKPLYSYVACLTSRPANLLKIMILAFWSNAPSFSTRAKNGDPNKSKDDDYVPTPCNKSGTDPNRNTVGYRFPERHNELVDCYNAVEIAYDILKGTCGGKLVISDGYPVNRDKLTKMLTQLKRMWDGHLGLMTVGQNQIQLNRSENWSIHSVLPIGR